MRAIPGLLVLAQLSLAPSLAPVVPAAAGHQQQAALPQAIAFDRRSFSINGTRQLILSGSIHYNRVLPSDWDRVLKLAKGMGLNTIETYFFWSFHEPQRSPDGALDWTGWRNLTAFVRLAQANGLYVTLRVGPYSCGEYTYGGIPTWMQALGAQCFRCSDPVWKREMQRVVASVVQEVTPLLLPNGGPIALLQIENEYRGSDLSYLSWTVDMARNLTTAVPWILCHDMLSCTKVNAGADKALCTINDVWMDTPDTEMSTFPSPGWMKTLQRGNPNQPPAWTEDQAWMDMWGDGQLTREVSEELYGMARWFAYGGALHNFYMFTGGNNYGREAALGITTAYAPDAPVDNLLLRAPKYDVFGAFFRALHAVEAELLSHPPPTAVQFPHTYHPDPDPRDKILTFPVGCEYHEYGSLAFLSNYGCNNTKYPLNGRSECSGESSRDVVYRGRTYHLQIEPC